MDANEVPLNVCIDLSKAFDSLNHKILFSKLKFYGVTGLSLDLQYYIATCPTENSVRCITAHSLISLA